MCFQRTTTIIRVNPSKNNSTESQNLLEIPQIPPAINRISLPSQSTAPEESLAPIFVASEQGLDTSVYKRVFKPPRLKSQICFIYLQEFVCSAASQLRISLLKIQSLCHDVFTSHPAYGYQNNIKYKSCNQNWIKKVPKE